jgi:predicted metal-dependent hydrolase
LPAAQQLTLAFDAGSGPAPTCRALPQRPSAHSDLASTFTAQRPLEQSEPLTHTVFVRHPRARRYLLRVVDERTIRVTVPRWGSRRGAIAFVEQERRWIDRQRQQIRAERARRLLEPVLAMPSIALATAPDANRMHHREVLERARCVLSARLIELAAHHRLTVTRVSIRNQRWRWGSCSRSGHICLNWRLVTVPAWVRDYVLVHELMHLKRMDHSQRFWKLVAAACPEYEAARRYLREHSMLLASDHPK